MEEDLFMEKIRWGILGPGAIAHKFVQALLTLEDAQIKAVGSRDIHRSQEFAKTYGIPKAYGSYEELVRDDQVDIIYIATPHSAHKENMLLCLNAGKAVLCEKSFTINADEAREVIRLAREKKLFLMEAMWTRFLPAIKKVREWLEQGFIGDIHLLKADFGISKGGGPHNRLVDPALGGGALLDVGIYPVSFASMIFGKQPETIKSLVHLGPTGVDEQSTILFGYEQGRMASLCSAIETELVNDAWIYGTQGYIHIPDFFYAKKAKLCLRDGRIEEFGPEFESTGYQYEAMEAMDCLRNGALESSIISLDETVAIMETMDKLRAQWNLKYPMEK
jgi:predicted dehydrogenase